MLIVHRCIYCRCPDIFASLPDRISARGWPRQGLPANAVPKMILRLSCTHQSHNNDRQAHHPATPCKWGPPALMAEFDGFGAVITEIRRPGPPPKGSPPRSRGCDCDACWRLYRELTGAPA